MKYYTELISTPLAEKLKEKGMPILIEQEWYPNGMPKAEKDCHKPMTKFSEVFDWLMSEKDYTIAVNPMQDHGRKYMARLYHHKEINYIKVANTWHEAAEKTIEKALTLI